MSYTIMATSKTPALVVYLLDISASMDKRLGKKSRLETAMDALNAAIRTMVFRSSKGRRIQPRYRLAIYAYSNEVYDLLGGIRSIDEVAQMNLPEIDTRRGTDTARAFAAAGEFIGYELPSMQEHPAPLVCHLTDDRFTGRDPEPIVKAIMRMGNQDGSVLVENIYISDSLGNNPNTDALTWTGIQPQSSLEDEYGRKLRDMSSALPASYHLIMQEMGSKVKQDSVMMFPGNTPDLISLGFQMSSATGVGRSA
jgi:hypothetical protein